MRHGRRGPLEALRIAGIAPPPSTQTSLRGLEAADENVLAALVGQVLLPAHLPEGLRVQALQVDLRVAGRVFRAAADRAPCGHGDAALGAVLAARRDIMPV